ncbi:MAG TPA: hypothetical protein VIV11_35785 [Kofleriaceae bacterium]
METVEARLAALDLAVEDLRAQLREAHARLDEERTRIRTMRLTHVCPSCGGKRVLQFRRVNEVGDSGVVPLSLNTKYRMWSGVHEGDPLEAYVCRACGLVEWHAPAVDKLVPDGTTIIELTDPEPAPPERDPYR